MRRALFALLTLGIWAGLTLPAAGPGSPPPDRGDTMPTAGPVFSSASVVVVDVATGRLLVGHNAYAKRPPGPLVHMLTALTVVTYADVEGTVRISRRAAEQPGVRIGVVPGAEMPVFTLLQGLWYTGAADAARALADHVAGSEGAFLRQMAEEARRQGALETKLASFLGDPSGSASTAYDLALLARAALNHPALGPLAGTRKARVTWDGSERQLFHVNSFLWRHPGATGVKSGHAEGAGYVAAASARRGERHLVAVVLGANAPDERYRDLKQALDFAFRHYDVLLHTPWSDALPYDVQPGETLVGIAAATGLSVGQIQEWNELDDPNRLSAGTRLWLPTGRARPAGESGSA